MTLYWGLLGDWPPTLGISLRPTQGGAFVPDPNGAAGAIVQVDAPAPLHGLAAAGDPLIADSYRVPMPPGADGVLLIVYEKTGTGSGIWWSCRCSAPNEFGDSGGETG